MKILRITTLLDFGGQEKKYISFTDHPELLQNEYIFAAIGYGGNAENILKERGFEVHVLNRKFSIRNLSNIFSLYKFIRKIKPDVVHTAAAEANFYGIIAARLAGVKVVIGEEIGIPRHSVMAKRVFSIVYRWADRVVCVSCSVKEHLIKTGEIRENKGVVIYNPVSIPPAYDSIHRSTKFEIVYVGRLVKVKNLETLIRAFVRLKNEEVHLTLVGEGTERENLERLAQELSVSNNVSFVGFCNEPSKYLCSADVFVLPSCSEGFGIAAVEAMFLKIPVLCSKVGGIPEFVKDGENGLLFDPNNEEELVSKLKIILSMKYEEKKEMGKRGFDDVINTFTVEKYIENLEQFYSEIHA